MERRGFGADTVLAVVPFPGAGSGMLGVTFDVPADSLVLEDGREDAGGGEEEVVVVVDELEDKGVLDEREGEEVIRGDACGLGAEDLAAEDLGAAGFAEVSFGVSGFGNGSETCAKGCIVDGEENPGLFEELRGAIGDECEWEGEMAPVVCFCAGLVGDAPENAPCEVNFPSEGEDPN